MLKFKYLLPLQINIYYALYVGIHRSKLFVSGSGWVNDLVDNGLYSPSSIYRISKEGVSHTNSIFGGHQDGYVQQTINQEVGVLENK